MKTLNRFFIALMCVAPLGVANAVVSTTAGSNLTAYNGESGATNNNRWNTAMNMRSGGNETAATADFGNCNAVIMRCAQPKCSNGGCTDMDVTYAIVNGCVQSTPACKQYGDELVDYISAQLVANSTAKANAASNAAQSAATQAAAQQSAQQMAAMQQQMQQMQAEMAAQNAKTVAQLQSALDEQKQLTANAIAEATAAREVTQPTSSAAAVSSDPTPAATNGLTDAQVAAASKGVSADILAREQIAGQIMSSIENADVSLKKLQATMKDVFTYAGCDSRGNNCAGPKRVKVFKQKAEDFFDPYESVLDELYDALIQAQSVGVDITDIYMMLNGTCNAWAQYVCTNDQVMHYTSLNCENGKSLTEYKDGQKHPTGNGKEESIYTGLRGGANCVIGQVVPMSDGGCQLVRMLTNNEEVQRNWLYPEEGDDTMVRVGCASEALDNSKLFRNRKRQANIDIETLQNIIAQDAPASVRTRNNNEYDVLKYCAVDEKMYSELQKLATTKSLPAKKLCINENDLNKNRDLVYLINSTDTLAMAQAACTAMGKNAQFSKITSHCYCEPVRDPKTRAIIEGDCNEAESLAKMQEDEKYMCENSEYRGATYVQNIGGAGTCNCNNVDNTDGDRDKCECRFNHKCDTTTGGGTVIASFNPGTLQVSSYNAVTAATKPTLTVEDVLGNMQHNKNMEEINKKVATENALLGGNLAVGQSTATFNQNMQKLTNSMYGK